MSASIRPAINSVLARIRRARKGTPSPLEVADYWGDPAHFNPTWIERGSAALRVTGAFDSICDVGCGPQMALRGILPPHTRYVPCDLQAWSSEVTPCNLNAGDFPVAQMQSCDVTFVLGVLEYLSDVPGVLARLAKYAPRLTISYAGIDRSPKRFPYWVNDYTLGDILSFSRAAGYRLLARETHRGEHHILALAL